MSTEEQKRGFSLDGQRSDCRDYADQQGYQVVRILSDVDSGRNLDRSGFQRLLELAVAGAFDVVVVWRRDRFARHAIGAGFFEDIMRRAGVRLEAVELGPEDDTPQVRFMHRIRDAVSELEASQIAGRMMLGKRTKAKTGRWPHQAPFGYRKVDGRLVVQPDQAARMREAYDECIRGANRIRIATAMGVHPTVAVDRLRRTYYKGEPATYNGVSVPCPAIVTPETWQAAQDALDSRYANPTHRRPTYSVREPWAEPPANHSTMKRWPAPREP